MADGKTYETPLLDELTRGPWPSFVKEIKLCKDKSPMCNDLLGQLEQSYREKIGHWKHGGIVGVLGYGGGVIGRYSDLQDKFPECAHFHTVRVNQPSGFYYTTDALRTLCEIWENHGSGLTNMHGSTGDIVFLGTTTPELEPIFAELTAKDWDLGGSGSNVRTPSCCLGQSRCEWACYDTMEMCYKITMQYQDELHRPQFPYKWKFKFSGCPNDCVAAIARSDLAFIGTWKDDMRVDSDKVAEYVDGGLDLVNTVMMNCPTKCLQWDGKTFDVDNANCVRCMHCINVMPKALRPGVEGGATILIGAKAPIIQGAQIASVLVPFIDPMEDYDDLLELIENMWELWSEHGKNRERVGEFIQRIGMSTFLEGVGLEPLPEHVAYPRDNPYIFFKEEEAEGE
ncbi:MAG: dissimilatory-type sulfite reductase subunit alpha [bacterium]